MDFSDLLQQRHACHHFVPHQTIPDEALTAIIQDTSLSPSGYNAQPWEFVIIRKSENLQKIHEIAFNQTHLKNASAVIIVLGDLEIGRNVDQLLKDWVHLGYCTPDEVPAYRNSIAKNRSPEKRKDMALRNSMMAAMTLIWSAENRGYATCPMMGFSQHQLETFLNIPNDRLISLMIAIGHHDDRQKKRERLPRKRAEDLIHWEKF